MEGPYGVFSDGSHYCYEVSRVDGVLSVSVGLTCTFLEHSGLPAPLGSCTVRLTGEVHGVFEELVGDENVRYLLVVAVHSLGVQVAHDMQRPREWLAALPCFPVPRNCRRTLGLGHELHGAPLSLTEAGTLVLSMKQSGLCTRDDLCGVFVHVKRAVHEALRAQLPEVKCCEDHAYAAPRDEATFRIVICGGELECVVRRKGDKLLAEGSLLTRAFMSRSGADTLASRLDVDVRVGKWHDVGELEAKRAFCAIATAARLCAMLPPCVYPLLDPIASCAITTAHDGVVGAIMSRTGPLRIECELARGTYIFGVGGTNPFVAMHAVCRLLKDCDGEPAWRTLGCLAADVDAALELSVGVVGQSAVAFTCGSVGHHVAGTLLVTRGPALDVTSAAILLRNSYEGQKDVDAVADRIRTSQRVRVEPEWVWGGGKSATQHRERSCSVHATMHALKMAREVAGRPRIPRGEVRRRMKARCEPAYAAVCAHALTAALAGKFATGSVVRNSLLCTALFASTVDDLTLCATIQCNGDVMLSAWTASEAEKLELRDKAWNLKAEVGSRGLAARWPRSEDDRGYAEARQLLARLGEAMVAAAARRGGPVTVRMYQARVWPASLVAGIGAALARAGFEESRSLPYMHRRYEPRKRPRPDDHAEELN
jgi:hypothetical protein